MNKVLTSLILSLLVTTIVARSRNSSLADDFVEQKGMNSSFRPNSRDAAGNTVLHLAARTGSLARVLQLLEESPSLATVQNNFFRTPRQEALLERDRYTDGFPLRCCHPDDFPDLLVIIRLLQNAEDREKQRAA